jgi:biotin transport system substrate-specific component
MEKTTKKKKINYTVLDISLIAIFSVLIAICSWISIPLVVPFTLQTFAIFLTLGLIGGKRGMLSIITYILLGLIGIPVFSGFKATAALVGPTGGYIVGFIFTGLSIYLGELISRNKSRLVQIISYVIFAIIGLLLCYTLGTIWYYYVYNSDTTKASISFYQALKWCVIPFILPDLGKLLAATIMVITLKKYIPTNKSILS